MENDDKSGCKFKDDSGSSKMKCISVDSSTSTNSVATDSYCSRSLTRATPVRKLISPSLSSKGKARQLEEQMCTLAKKTLKRVEKRRMSTFLKRFEKHEQCFVSSYSVLKKSEKDSNSLGIKPRKVTLEKTGKQLKLDTRKWSRNVKQGVKPESYFNKRMRLDASSYRKLFKPRPRKAKVSDPTLGKGDVLSQGGVEVIRADASKEVGEEVVERCFSCSKRQRVDFDLKHKCCSCSAELSHDLCGSSLPKDGRDLESMLSIKLSDEFVDDVPHKESHLETETNGKHNACIICMLGGKLLICDGKGCKRSYHLSCLDPPLSYVPPGVWHCIWCVKKKIESGVHCVSEVESIWDAREVISGHEVQRQKQYLVKYRGLAHVHNCWIPETQLLLEAPKLVGKFNRKKQAIRWKTEWTVPHRLLHKRSLFRMHHDEYCHGKDDIVSDCHYEWLVKWTGLGYDHATWELENASFLRSPEAMKLIRDYESRHEKTERTSSLSRADKVLQEGKGVFSELSELSFGGSPGEHNRHLSYVNKLRQKWHEGQNAVVVDDQVDQERVMKAILFILSLEFNVWRPFLVISTSSAFSAWESEFSRLAPSANIVVYKGTRDLRSSIRTLEFYNKSGDVMFQVLLSSLDVVVEDLKVLECIGWEAIIIDECQRSRMSKHFGKIKMLDADMRLLVVSGQIKDCAVDYLNLLSLLDSGFDGLKSDATEMDPQTNICHLKERLAQHITFEHKLNSSRFVEYWVPVQLTNVQLEQYCATLLSNSMLLCSRLKNDPADAFRDVIISTRKCCDHPYLLDQSLQSFVTKGLPIEEYLDVRIKVSAKLQLLDKILLEIRNRGLRVLILFQSIGGSGRDSIGDILDDFVCQRFGKDSYVRIYGGGYARSKKKAVLNMFNDKESGKFVFLIENRACLPSIKLSSVDTVILFDSDWDPLNDLRALQKINIASRFEQLKVFRIYSSCTVEEKVLILAKEGVTLDSSIHSINRNICHTLLTWGASYLFNKLNDFHSHNTSVSGSNIFSEQSLLNDVLCELLTLLPHSVENKGPNCPIISKVQQNGGTYATNIPLLGEVEMQSMDNEPPVTNLLEGRRPRWKFLSTSSQRIRRKVHFFHNSPEKSECENGGLVKKARKVVNNTDPTHLKSWLKDKRKLHSTSKGGQLAGASGNTTGDESQFLQCSIGNMDELNHVYDSSAVPPVADDISSLPQVDMVESVERKKLCDVWNGAQCSLKPEISKLCEILQLPENVKGTAVRFLEYIMNDYKVTWKEVSSMHAFQISLCWAAASLSKYRIDRKESLALANQLLKFECKEEEADHIYSKLVKIKKIFACHAEYIESVEESNCAKTLKSITCDLQELEGEFCEGIQNHNCSNQSLPATMEQAPGSRMAQKNDISSSIRKVLEICGRRIERLLQKQEKEVQEFDKMMREEKAKLEEGHRLESALIRSRDSDISVRLDKLRLDKLRMLDHNFKEKMNEHSQQMEMHWRNLEATHQASRIEEEQLKAKWIVWLEETKSGRSIVASDNFTLAGFEFKVDKLEPSKLTGCHDDPEYVNPKTMPYLQNQNHSGNSQNVPSGIPQISLNEKAFCSLPMETVIVPIESDTENDGMEVMTSSKLATTCVEQQSKAGSSSDGPENGAPMQQSPDRNRQIMLSVEKHFEVPQTVSNEVDKGNHPMKMSTHAIQPHEESVRKDAVTLERAIFNEVRQTNGANTTICRELPASTHSSMLQPDICLTQGSSLPSHQQPVSTNPSSAESNVAAIPVVIGIQDHQSSGMHASSQEAQVSRQPPIEDPVELPNPSIVHPIIHLPLQPSTGMPVGGRETHVPYLRSITTVSGSVNDHPFHAVPAMPEMPQPACSDPLRIEMERIQKDKEQALKLHEDMILRLKSECNREIEVTCRKYELLIQDAEAAVVLKMKDLETYYDKVHANKLLAAAFTHKNNYNKAAQLVGPKQGTVPSFVDHLMQQIAQTYAPRSEQPLASQPMTGPPVAPPVMAVNNSSTGLSTGPAALSTSPVRPHSSPTIRCFAGNLQSGPEIRAPAPHLQAFKTSSSVSTANVPTLCSGLRNQQSPINPLTTTVILTQQTPRMHTGSYSRFHPPESARWLPVTHGSLSALQLPLGFNDCASAYIPNPQHHICSTFHTLSPSEVATNGTVGNTTTSSSAAADIVCLTDNDQSNDIVYLFDNDQSNDN